MDPLRDDLDRLFPILEHAVVAATEQASQEAETDLIGTELAKTRRYLQEVSNERGILNTVI